VWLGLVQRRIRSIGKWPPGQMLMDVALYGSYDQDRITKLNPGKQLKGTDLVYYHYIVSGQDSFPHDDVIKIYGFLLEGKTETR
jgi:hypothetical protein